MKTTTETEQPDTMTSLGQEAGQEFDTLMSKRQANHDKIKELQAANSAYDLMIGAYLDKQQLDKTAWVNGETIYVVYKRKGSAPRRTIDPNKLLQHNVAASVIEACTVYGKAGKPGIGVRKVGEPENDDAN